MLKKINEEFGKLNEPDFIEALYSGKIEKPEHIKQLQKALELMGINKEQEGGVK